MLIAQQIRAARALIGWSQNDLATAANVGIATVRRIELQDGFIHANANSIRKMETALKTSGVEFIEQDESSGPGVRLQQSFTE
jgi:ribosome-binding protein aMBF1 (putative translation factor)